MKKLRVISICCVLASIFLAFVFSSCSEQGALHTHTLTRVPAQQSYCLKEGNIEYWKCDECGKYFADEAAQEEISLEETVLPFKHRPVYVEGQEADGIFSCGSISHYRCSACGALFADEAATQPIDESDVYEQKTFTLTEARITNTASSAQTVRVYADYEEEYYDLAVTESTFVLRVFLGWEGADINDVGQNIGGRVNLNIDTEENIASGKWMSFRIGYNAQGGYAYFSDTGERYFMDMENGGKLTLAIRENAGLYVTLVRSGGTMTAYAEDLDGNLIMIGESRSFGTSALVKCTLGVHQNYYATEEHPAVLKDGVLVIGSTDPSSVR